MATWSGAVAASTDDAQEISGTVTVDGNVINAGGAAQYIGLRFLPTVPAGSTINSAYVDVNLTSGSFDDPDVTIYLEDVDNAAAFAAVSNNISTRPPTSATASWDASNLGTGWKSSPDFAAAVQEVVERAGWNSGQGMVVIIKGDDSSSFFRISTYDSSAPAVLYLDYTEPSGGDIVPLVMHHRMQLGMS